MPRKASYWLVILAFTNCWIYSLSISADDEERIKSTFLSIFGFEDVPNTDRTKYNVPNELKKLYEVQTDFDLDTASIPLPGMYTASANTIRSFTHIESPIDERFKTHHKFRLKFDLSSIPKDERLIVSELKLTRQLNDIKKTSNNYYQRLLVNEILKPGKKGIHGPITRLIDSKIIDIRKNDTLSVDLTPAVLRWLNEPLRNYGILISIVSGKKSNTKSGNNLIRNVRLKRNVNDDVDEDNWSINQPLLLTYTDDGKNKQKTGQDMLKIRSKRASRRNHRKGDQRDPCKRRPMSVNFRDVGWSDWIVAPLGYEAYYCDGECEYPMAEHMNTTNHAIVQSLMNSARPYDVPKPCCVPTQLSSISMLYVDSKNNVILKNYKEMVVIGCGCR